MADASLRFSEFRPASWQRLFGAVERAGGEAEKELVDLLRSEVKRGRADALARFASLPGVGRKVADAKPVSAGATKNGAYLRLRNSPPYVFGREFGSKGPRTTTYQLRGKTVVRYFDYSKPSVFGPWTGNQFEFTGPQPPGRAFYPATRRVVDDLDPKLGQLGDRLVERLARS